MAGIPTNAYSTLARFPVIRWSYCFSLLRVLAGVTVFTAVAVFACLRVGNACGATLSTIEG